MSEDRPARTVLVDCLGLRAGEALLAVTDPARRAIAERLVDQGRALGAEAVLLEMQPRVTDGAPLPPPVARAMAESDVIVAPTTKSLSHTQARRDASALGRRVASMPGITSDMLDRTMAADFGELREASRAVAAALTAARSVHITAPGTDVMLSVEGRTALADDGDLTAPGAFGNLPPGEGFVAPVEGSANGVISFDGSLAGLGRLDEPLVVTVVDGYATNLEGPRAAELRALLDAAGPEAFAVAELGIGTNPAATLTGAVLEDEKIAGTIHVAFGDNRSFGGSIAVASHIDGVVLAPRVDLDGRTILAEGRLRL